MVKTSIIFVAVLLAMAAVATEAALYGDCPPSSQHTTCSPKCLTDADCSQTGGKCCPNICNLKSCAIPKQGSNTDKYKGVSTGAGGHCGNVKCGAFEKCGQDPQTKRPKCVRA